MGFNSAFKGLIDRYRRFRRTCYFHLYGLRLCLVHRSLLTAF